MYFFQIEDFSSEHTCGNALLCNWEEYFNKIAARKVVGIAKFIKYRSSGRCANCNSMLYIGQLFATKSQDSKEETL
ncbi:hypothetical protein QE152_g40611 [Popillia japonica]|uniref:Uncharacterized protein n=1 Tax=Popillia japonica TaxID=7064 RepID=A0AAW1HFS0_POPJA